MQATNDTPNKSPEVDDSAKDSMSKAHVVRRNIEDYLEQKALDRRLTEVIDEEFNLGW